jgi:hypothetical protein
LFSKQKISIRIIMMALNIRVGKCIKGAQSVKTCATCKLGIFKFHATYLKFQPTIFLFLYMNVKESFASMSFFSFKIYLKSIQVFILLFCKDGTQNSSSWANPSLGGTTKNHVKEWLKNQK